MPSLVDRVRAAVDPLDAVHEPAPPARRTAAVLLLFDPGDPGLPLLFVQRTEHLRHHAGQIGFPGGGTEPGDAGVVATALREAEEETGVPSSASEVLGLLPPFLTATSDNWLTPVVALQSEPVRLHADSFEVARLFWVRLSTLSEAPHTVRTMTRDGHSRAVHFYEADGNVIWGVTAAIIAELLARLD